MTTKKRTRQKGAEAAPSVEMIVRRGALRRFDKLKQATANLPVQLSWDRRLSERRSSGSAPDTDRRKKDRRQPPPFTWTAADFLVIERPPLPRPARSRRSSSGQQ